MRIVAAVVAVAVAAPFVLDAQDRAPESRRTGAAGRLAPTAHPPLPSQPSQFWFAPPLAAARTASVSRGEGAAERLGRGAKAIAQGRHSEGLPLVNPAAFTGSPLVNYALYYTGVAQLALGRTADAESTFTTLAARKPEGFLQEAVPMRLADTALARSDAERAEDILEELSSAKLSAPEEVFLRLAQAEERINHRDHALDGYRKVYYEFPLSTQASDAQRGLERLETGGTVAPDRFTRELGRAETLFTARRWAQARAAYEVLLRAAQGTNHELISIRLAECDYYLDRHRAARDRLAPYVDGGSREAEARFFYLTATLALGDARTYVTLARDLVADHPESDWSAEALNNLATYYIRQDDDAEADRVFRELLRRFPSHRHAERAAWRSGWWAYRDKGYADAIAIFEAAAATFPRGDNRPAWLYWSGKARERMGDQANASARYRLVVTDYQNTYYGRLAERLLEARGEPRVLPAVSSSAAAPGTSVPNDAVIRALTAAHLYDEALREVQYAQRVWGDSSQLQATVAWIRHHQGLELRAFERFNALRGAINTMRRAYPQFMAAGGEGLPPDVLRIIFPLDYWPLIRKYSDAQGLDPYLVAALMAQESTFTAEIRSSANAYGLMQVIPDTGRRVARQLGIRGFTTAMLTQPETNVRIGTKYFKDVMEQFGGAHYALASYNAGPHRVKQWLAENPGLPQDEFIDNIPFPETQTYVKRILGTAEDYRRLYGSGILDPNARLVANASSATPAPTVRPTTPARRAPARPAARRPARRR